MSGSSGKVQETSAQKALAQHAKLVMDDYTARWLPVQQNLATQIESMGKPGSWQRSEAAGKASTDTAIQFSGAQGALEKSLSNSGAAPGTGRADLATTGLGFDAAKSSGLGQMISGQQIDDAYTKGLGALTQIGQGQATSVSNSMENQAATSGLQAQADAKAALMDQMGIAGGVGTAIGLAGQQYSKSGGHDSSGLPNIPGMGPGNIG
jgi:hypothetical protein